MLEDLENPDYKKLEAALKSMDAPSLPITSIHGMVTAVLCAPDVIPPSQWLPLVFYKTDEMPEFRDEKQASKVTSGLLGMYNKISAELRSDAFTPFLQLEEKEGKPVRNVSTWVRGFILGIELFGDAAAPSDDREFMDMMTPFLILQDPAAMLKRRDGRKVTQEESDIVCAGLTDGLGDCVLGLREYWRRFSTAGTGPSMPKTILPDNAVPFQRTEGKAGRNDPCPCGSGLKYKKCCGSPAAQAAAGPESRPKEAAGKTIDSITDDFDGFSPSQMHQILYSAGQPGCPIQIRGDLPDEVYLEGSPAFRLAYKILLAIAAEKNGLKLTQAGYLPGKLVKALYAEKILPEDGIERGFSKLSSEKDWISLRSVNIALLLSPLIRKKYQHLHLTQAGRNSLDSLASLFKTLLFTYISKFNWGCNDLYPEAPIGQLGSLFLFHLLKRYGEDWRDFGWYHDAYFRAFPALKRGLTSEHDYPYGYHGQILLLRFVERFAKWFGLLEIRKTRIENSWRENVDIRRTAFLNCLLAED